MEYAVCDTVQDTDIAVDFEGQERGMLAGLNCLRRSMLLG